MKKSSLILIISLIIIALVFNIFFSSHFKQENKTKDEKNTISQTIGTIKEIHLDYFQMEPSELEKSYPNYFLMENEKKEEFEVYFTNELNLSVGMKVKITYDGVLLSIPPQVYPLSLEILD